MHYVYKIINKINEKIYVGQTSDLNARWKNHCSAAKDVNYSHPLYNSMRKYGVDNFRYEIIEQFENLADCNKSEEYWISNLKTQDRAIGYNIAFGGDNKEVSQETKNKLSELNSGEGNPFYGRIHSEETKQKITKAITGMIASDETKQKMSESKRGENNSFYGRVHSEESKKKMSESQSGKIISEKTRQKLSDAKRGKNHNMYGKKHSDESKKKMSDAKKGKKCPRKP